MAPQFFHVAIIGAGLSGPGLTLSLYKQSNSCSLYEGRETLLDIGDALMLMPNGLKALDKLGPYDNICKQGYSFDSLYFPNALIGKIVKTVEFGSLQTYRVRALRIYRHALFQELLSKARKVAIPIHFNRKYSHVVSESTEEGVTWQFADGSTATASISRYENTSRQESCPPLLPKQPSRLPFQPPSSIYRQRKWSI